MMVKVDVPGIGNGFGQEIARFAKTKKKTVLHKIQTQERSLPNLRVRVSQKLLYKKGQNAPTLVVVHCCTIFL